MPTLDDGTWSRSGHVDEVRCNRGRRRTFCERASTGIAPGPGTGGAIERRTKAYDFDHQSWIAQDALGIRNRPSKDVLT